ncbi:myelin-associated glycoprotein isoform X1 [Cololabis saira]|uniref:myelin-associated glycoprotein isoform X1 n=1 Tax=Cololabis saira TaxID=129043 RepID=UPI002AD49B77|nr:myelin-associated glycoprotein isoform X1 [Cololabis saira]
MRTMDKVKENTIFFLLLAAVCSTVFGDGEWGASIPSSLDALVSSCIVIPCTFTHPAGHLPHSRLRGIWHLSDKRNEIIYHEDKTKILESFKDRTDLKGNLGENNCTLEITPIKDHDNGPFCFRLEYVRTDRNEPTPEKFSFADQCVEFKMLYTSPEPQLTQLKSAVQGKPYTVTCSVHHTCPLHPPTLSWTLGTADEIAVKHESQNLGRWKTESILTFIPVEKDDYTELTCTATFNGGAISSKSLTLYVKRTENYNHIIIPVAAVVGTAIVFGLFCILMVKKYKTRISELQRQDGSMWNRMSRLSRRFRHDRPGPSRSEERQETF